MMKRKTLGLVAAATLLGGCQALFSDVKVLYSVPDDCTSLGIVVADAYSAGEAVSNLQGQVENRGGNTLRMEESNPGEGGYNHGPDTGFEFQRHRGEAFNCPEKPAQK